MLIVFLIGAFLLEANVTHNVNILSSKGVNFNVTGNVSNVTMKPYHFGGSIVADHFNIGTGHTMNFNLAAVDGMTSFVKVASTSPVDIDGTIQVDAGNVGFAAPSMYFHSNADIQVQDQARLGLFFGNAAANIYSGYLQEVVEGGASPTVVLASDGTQVSDSLLDWSGRADLTPVGFESLASVGANRVFIRKDQLPNTASEANAQSLQLVKVKATADSVGLYVLTGHGVDYFAGVPGVTAKSFSLRDSGGTLFLDTQEAGGSPLSTEVTIGGLSLASSISDFATAMDTIEGEVSDNGWDALSTETDGGEIADALSDIGNDDEIAPLAEGEERVLSAEDAAAEEEKRDLYEDLADAYIDSFPSEMTHAQRVAVLMGMNTAEITGFLGGGLLQVPGDGGLSEESIGWSGSQSVPMEIAGDTDFVDFEIGVAPAMEMFMDVPEPLNDPSATFDVDTTVYDTAVDGGEYGFDPGAFEADVPPSYEGDGGYGSYEADVPPSYEGDGGYGSYEGDGGYGSYEGDGGASASYEDSTPAPAENFEAWSVDNASAVKEAPTELGAPVPLDEVVVTEDSGPLNDDVGAPVESETASVSEDSGPLNDDVGPEGEQAPAPSSEDSGGGSSGESYYATNAEGEQVLITPEIEAVLEENGLTVEEALAMTPEELAEATGMDAAPGVESGTADPDADIELLEDTSSGSTEDSGTSDPDADVEALEETSAEDGDEESSTSRESYYATNAEGEQVLITPEIEAILAESGLTVEEALTMTDAELAAATGVDFAPGREPASLGEAISNVGDAVVDAVDTVGDAAVKAAEDTATAVTTAAETAVTDAVEAVETTVDEVVTEVEAAAQEAAEAVDTAIEETTAEVDAALTEAEMAAQEAADEIEQAAQEIADEAERAAEEAQATVEETVEEVEEAVKETAAEIEREAQEIAAEAERAAEEAEAAIVETVEEVEREVQETVDETVQAVEETVEEIEREAQEIADEAERAAAEAEAAIVETVEEVEREVQETVDETVQAVEETVEEVEREAQEIAAEAERAAEEAEAAIVETVEEVEREVQETVDAVDQAIDDTVEAVEETAQDIEDTMTEAEKVAREKVDAARAEVEGTLTEVEKAAREKADAARTKSRAAVRTATKKTTDGIRSASNKLVSLLGGTPREEKAASSDRPTSASRASGRNQKVDGLEPGEDKGFLSSIVERVGDIVRGERSSSAAPASRNQDVAPPRGALLKRGAPARTVEPVPVARPTAAVRSNSAVRSTANRPATVSRAPSRSVSSAKSRSAPTQTRAPSGPTKSASAGTRTAPKG